MSESTTQTGDSDELILNCPEALRRLGPSRLVIDSMSGGPAPRVTGSGVHLYANSRYALRVVPPRPEPGETASVQKPEGCDYIKVTDHIETNLAGGAKECKIIFTVSSLIFPLPVQTALSIPIHHSALGTVSQSISLVIWPTFLNQLMWLGTLPALGTLMLNLSNRVSISSAFGLIIGGILLIYPVGKAIGWLSLFVSTLFRRS